MRIDRSSLGHFRPAARVALLHPHWRRVTKGKDRNQFYFGRDFRHSFYGEMTKKITVFPVCRQPGSWRPAATQSLRSFS
jgi:hypothetical protein